MNKGAIRAAVAAVLVFGAVLGFRWAERDGRFDLETVYVTGLGCADTCAVAEVLKTAFGVPLHTLDTDSLAREFMAVPGIRSASFTPIWPSSAHLSIELENAAVVLETPSGQIPVNTLCRELPAEWLSSGLPVIRYSHEPDPEVLARAVVFTDWLGGVRDDALVILDSTGVTVMDEDVLILLGSDMLKERWNSWNRVRPLATEACQVDLRFRGQAVLRRST